MNRLELKESLMFLYCSYEDRLKAKVISGYRWDKTEKAWVYSLDYEVFLQIKQTFNEITISPDIEDHFKKQEESVKKGSEFKANLLSNFEVPEIIKNLKVKTSPRKHQPIGVAFMLSQDCTMLCDEMGLGKTFQAMMAAISRRQMGQVKRCLVVCPATLKGTWRKEIEKHTYENGIVIDGTKKQRENQLAEYVENDKILFLIVNYESLRIDAFKFNFDMIILDESVRIKNPKAATTKVIKKMQAPYKIGISGYPVANRIEDIWSQIDWIRPGYLGNKWA
ncbi:DEAD/DEAH box helicase family protein, partial [Candidatus Pacearchaeota archaeon]|nr:DEAD/DEAH box helicase family protein [Candidatus Pacearchaeota archaeon]